MSDTAYTTKYTPSHATTEYFDPPLPDLDVMPIPLSALLVDMRAPSGRIVQIFDILNYVACMERVGYVRAVSESGVTL
jgi:hypothetical protein